MSEGTPNPRYAGIPGSAYIEAIDERVLPLVLALNALPDVLTDSSCGGHDEPTNVSQETYPAWYIGFVIEESRYGVWSLERVVQVAGEHDAEVSAWFDGGLRFHLTGDGEPTDLASGLAASAPAVFAERA